MTAEAHVAESARHRQAAADEEKQYDPNATMVTEIRGDSARSVAAIQAEARELFGPPRPIPGVANASPP
jgi:hypothetical protein